MACLGFFLSWSFYFLVVFFFPSGATREGYIAKALGLGSADYFPPGQYHNGVDSHDGFGEGVLGLAMLGMHMSGQRNGRVTGRCWCWCWWKGGEGKFLHR